MTQRGITPARQAQIRHISFMTQNTPEQPESSEDIHNGLHYFAVYVAVSIPAMCVSLAIAPGLFTSSDFLVSLFGVGFQLFVLSKAHEKTEASKGAFCLEAYPTFGWRSAASLAFATSLLTNAIFATVTVVAYRSTKDPSDPYIFAAQLVSLLIAPLVVDHLLRATIQRAPRK